MLIYSLRFILSKYCHAVNLFHHPIIQIGSLCLKLDAEVCEFANENDLPSENSKFAIVHGAEAATNFVENFDITKYDSGILWLRNNFHIFHRSEIRLYKAFLRMNDSENHLKYRNTTKILS